MSDTRTPEPPLFPTGPFAVDGAPDARTRGEWIDELDAAPARLRHAVAGLSDRELDTAYRNWTIRQIAHHIADSHLNAYVRMKLALTEDRPTIKPYDESRWSELADAQRADVELSLRLLDAVHGRWIYVLRALPPDAWERAYYHPGSQSVVPLWEVLAQYTWHARHHTAQIMWVRQHALRWRSGG